VPTYCYTCDECGVATEKVLQMSASGNPQWCVCGKLLRRNYTAEAAVDSDRPYAKPIISDSLAVSASQVEEHRQKFPYIKIQDDGRPVIESARQHQRYLDDIGFHKV